MRYSKKCEKKTSVCFNEIVMKMRLEMKNGSQRYELIEIGEDMDTNILNINCVSV